MPSTPLSPLKRLFKQATERVLAENWQVFYCSPYWEEVLPCPDLSTLPNAPVSRLVSNAVGIHIPSLRENQLTWSLWATDFFNRYKERISRKLSGIERHLANELAIWNKNHSETIGLLPLEKVLQEWLIQVEPLTLKDFTELTINLATARKFLSPKFNEIKVRYGINLNDVEKQKLPVTILIKEEARVSLIGDILPYVAEEQHEILKILINEGKVSGGPIVCNCDQVRLGEIFYNRVKAEQKRERQIEADKTKLAKWIHDNFKRTESGVIKSISESTILNYLKNKGFAQYR